LERPSDAASLREALDEAIVWIRALKPRHWPGECDHCGIDELDPATCPVLGELARLDCWLTQRDGAQARRSEDA
jgi:hypothetical protein